MIAKYIINISEMYFKIKNIVTILLQTNYKIITDMLQFFWNNIIRSFKVICKIILQ